MIDIMGKRVSRKKPPLQKPITSFFAKKQIRPVLSPISKNVMGAANSSLMRKRLLAEKMRSAEADHESPRGPMELLDQDATQATVLNEGSKEYVPTKVDMAVHYQRKILGSNAMTLFSKIVLGAAAINVGRDQPSEADKKNFETIEGLFRPNY
jgi:hypothetical protein